MVKSTLDEKMGKSGLFAKLGLEGKRRFIAFLVGMLVSGAAFSSCYMNRMQAFQSAGHREALQVLRHAFLTIADRNYDQETAVALFEMARHRFPTIAYISVNRGSEREYSVPEKAAPVAAAEQNSLSDPDAFLRGGRVQKFTVLGRGGATMQGFLLPVVALGGEALSLSVVFGDAPGFTQLLPFLIAVLAGVIIFGVLFFLRMVSGGSQVGPRWFMILANAVFLVAALSLLMIAGADAEGRGDGFAADSVGMLVAKGVISGGEDDYNEMVAGFNKKMSGELDTRFTVLMEGDAFTVAVDGARAGSYRAPLFVLVGLAGLLALSLGYGGFSVMFRGLEGIKAVLSYGFIVVFIAICMLPVIWIISASFLTENDVKSLVSIVDEGDFFTKNYFTFENYEKNFSGFFLVYFRNSLFVSGVTAVFCGVLGILAGYAFSRFRFPGRRKQLMWILVSQLFPMAMMIVPLYIVAQVLGISQGLLIIIIAYSATSLPFSIWMMKGYFDTIPVDIEEAAAIDGASTFGRMWHVLLPLARPAIATTIFYSFITSWNEFAIASFFLNDNELRTLPVALNSMLDAFNPQYALFSSAGVLASLPVVLLFIYLQKHLVSGLMAGGVKG